MRKVISCVLTLSMVATIIFGLGCRVSSVSGTVTRTRTTGPNGTTTTTTVGGTVVITPFNLTSLSSGNFYVVVDLANAWQIDSASSLTPKLEVTKELSNGQLSTATFDMVLDGTNSISNVDKTTTPFVYRLNDANSFSSFISSTGNSEGEGIGYRFSFPITQVNCDVSGDYMNHLRLGSGSEIVYLGSFTYRVTPSLVASCDDDIEIVNVSTGGKDSINEFIDSLY